VLGGNRNHVEQRKIGGFGMVVEEGTAAIAPEQWGGKRGLRGHLGEIHGNVGGAPIFQGVSDVIGGEAIPPPYLNIRQWLMDRFPGTLLIELPSGDDLGVVPIDVWVPMELGCPDGTTRTS
jgi:hypothetical protein